MKTTNLYLIIFVLFTAIVFNSCFMVDAWKVKKLYGQSRLLNHAILDTIPFKYDNGWITLKVKLAGTDDERKFILDTHAGTTLFESSVPANQYETIKTSKALDFNGHIFEQKIIKIDSLTFGNEVVFHDVITAVSATLPTCSEIDGIIGRELMMQLNWQIDFENEIIIVSDSSEKLKYDENAFILPMFRPRSNGTFSLLISDGAKDEIPISVDLGAAINLFIFPSIVDKLQKNEVIKHTTTAKGKSGVSFSGNQKEKETTFGAIDRLRFPGSELVLDSVCFMSHRSFLMVFGSEFFSNFRTTIDYSNKRVILEPKKQNYKVSNVTFRGYSIKHEIDKVFLDFIYPNSPADVAGLKSGQQVLSVNNNNVVKIDFYNLCEITKEFGDTVRLEVQNSDSSVKNATLVRSPLSQILYN